jgi:hypothetical protein
MAGDAGGRSTGAAGADDETVDSWIAPGTDTRRNFLVNGTTDNVYLAPGYVSFNPEQPSTELHGGGTVHLESVPEPDDAEREYTWLVKVDGHGEVSAAVLPLACPRYGNILEFAPRSPKGGWWAVE